jgi:hypothetical protein
MSALGGGFNEYPIINNPEIFLTHSYSGKIYLETAAISVIDLSNQMKTIFSFQRSVLRNLAIILHSIKKVMDSACGK